MFFLVLGILSVNVPRLITQTLVSVIKQLMNKLEGRKGAIDGNAR